MLGSTSENYEGQFFITSIKYEKGKRQETREWIPRTVFNDTHMGYAICIGNGESRKKFNIDLLKNHRGGLLGSMACQTYGCNALYRNFRPDFLIANGKEICEEVATSKEYYDKPYATEGIVYSSAERCLEHPGKFHLVPHNVRMNAGALAVYLAAFDNHKNIYMIGYEGQKGGEGYNANMYAGTPGYMPHEHQISSEKWERNMCQIFSAYPNISFTIVDNHLTGYPGDYNWYKNVRKITYPNFISELDLGSFNHRSTD